MKDYHWCVTIHATIMWKIEMSILMPTKNDELEFPVMHEPEGVGLPVHEEDNDSDLDSCDNVDKYNVGDD